MRDAALDEASRTKSELRQLREAHEDLLLASRDAASRADVAHSQLMGELKLKGFELSRLQVCQGPREEQPATCACIGYRLGQQGASMQQ